ncbi:AraC family transcriptional regulator [Martelella alba]|uniref:Helix-turn-helix domain-containing protein n=1 Tax=Martelella alba TaxID=2590451 RepID=A0ABY2SH29_9HYPH|nr:helix-turn-helix transcriptional regulator [Martelella alba]TKI04488.1 helix-turn-helix domain-containing protein [Martelella alba]
MPFSIRLSDYDPDQDPSLATAMHIDMPQNGREAPFHRHRKGQLIMALRGGITCELADALWMVPPHCAVWIPGDTPHSNRVTANARFCFVFVEPGFPGLPDKSCTLLISPLLRELILALTRQPERYALDSVTGRMAIVMLEQLCQMPVENLYLPFSNHPKIRLLAEILHQSPDDRRTLPQWAAYLAVSERTLARLLIRETGMTFGRWRQRLQLIIASRQLASGVSVQRVAENLGYDSPSAFITMFKKALGKSPGHYFSAITAVGEAYR